MRRLCGREEEREAEAGWTRLDGVVRFAERKRTCGRLVLIKGWFGVTEADLE